MSSHGTLTKCVAGTTQLDASSATPCPSSGPRACSPTRGGGAVVGRGTSTHVDPTRRRMAGAPLSTQVRANTCRYDDGPIILPPPLGDETAQVSPPATMSTEGSYVGVAIGCHSMAVDIAYHAPSLSWPRIVSPSTAEGYTRLSSSTLVHVIVPSAVGDVMGDASVGRAVGVRVGRALGSVEVDGGAGTTAGRLLPTN